MKSGGVRIIVEIDQLSVQMLLNCLSRTKELLASLEVKANVIFGRIRWSMHHGFDRIYFLKSNSVE